MIYLEGTDGVGKTSTIELLKQYNINLFDREKCVFSKNMLFDVSMEDRIREYVKYFNSHEDKVIFLINNDKDELMNRIYKRDVISDFDMDAYEYNKLYLDTYNEMKKRNLLFNKLFLIDVAHMTLEEQVNAVKTLVEEIA